MNSIYVDFTEGIFTIMFQNPERRNAINHEMMKAIIHHLKMSAVDSNVKVTVLTGFGDFYSSGYDFGLVEDDFQQTLSTFKHLVALMIDYPKLLVAVVNGPAVGMSCTTLALCDIVFASDKALFLTPFTQLGLVAEGCSTYTFPRIFGPAKAAKLLYMNEVMPVQEAALFGFVTQVFPHEELHAGAFAYLRELTVVPTQSLMLTKNLVKCWDRPALHAANEQEVKVLHHRFHSEDFYIAMSNPEIIGILKRKVNQHKL